MNIKGVDETIKSKITILVNDLNRYIRAGTYNIYHEEANELIKKYGKNELLIAGCRIHESPGRRYVELPYNEITEAQTNSIIVSFQNFIGGVQR